MSKPTDYFEAERYFRGGFLLLVFGGVLVLLPVALAFGNGFRSPRALAAVLIVYATGVAFAVVVILRNARARTNISAGRLAGIPVDARQRKLRRSIRTLQLGVVFFGLVLVYAHWDTRNDPWPPRLVGASVNLLFQASMIWSIRILQKQLKRGDADHRQ
jgi:hypothetical protein